MVVDNRLVYYFAAAIVASAYLNASFVHYHPLATWARILPPICFAIGFFGSASRLGTLRVGGWFGIVMFFIVALGVSFPSEDHILGLHSDGPPEVGAFEIGARAIVGSGLTLLLFLTFRRASPKPRNWGTIFE
jgi:hypothetical protein